MIIMGICKISHTKVLLGRPSKQALSSQVSSGERNPVEGKFGQAKTAYGLDRIKARLSNTSESWVASIILVLNLVHLAEVALLWKIVKMLKLIFKEVSIVFNYFWYKNKMDREIRLA